MTMSSSWSEIFISKWRILELWEFINESDISDIPIQAGILTEGSQMSFVKGKYYKRCTRVHEILALTLEQKLYETFLKSLGEEADELRNIFESFACDWGKQKICLSHDEVLNKYADLYDAYFLEILNGGHGVTGVVHLLCKSYTSHLHALCENKRRLGIH